MCVRVFDFFFFLFMCGHLSSAACYSTFVDPNTYASSQFAPYPIAIIDAPCISLMFNYFCLLLPNRPSGGTAKHLVLDLTFILMC